MSLRVNDQVAAAITSSNPHAVSAAKQVSKIKNLRIVRTVIMAIGLIAAAITAVLSGGASALLAVISAAAISAILVMNHNQTNSNLETPPRERVTPDSTIREIPRSTISPRQDSLENTSGIQRTTTNFSSETTEQRDVLRGATEMQPMEREISDGQESVPSEQLTSVPLRSESPIAEQVASPSETSIFQSQGNEIADSKQQFMSAAESSTTHNQWMEISNPRKRNTFPNTFASPHSHGEFSPSPINTPSPSQKSSRRSSVSRSPREKPRNNAGIPLPQIAKREIAAGQKAPGNAPAVSAAEIRISREDEIIAMAKGKLLPRDESARRMNLSTEQLTREAMENPSGFPKFTRGYVIIAPKPGGVEGGFIVRRLWTEENEQFAVGSESLAVLQGELQKEAQIKSLDEEIDRLSSEFRRTPSASEFSESLDRKIASLDQQKSNLEANLINLPYYIPRGHLSPNELSAAIKALGPREKQNLASEIKESPEFRKSFMAKMLFGKKDIKALTFYRPSPRKSSHRAFTTRTPQQVQGAVLDEYFALQMATAFSPELVPASKLGVVDGKRYFLMTEILGSANPAQTFTVLDKVGDAQRKKIPAETVAKAYALTIGMLNDNDSGKADNLGILSGPNGYEMKAFDLGHPDPNAFQLDPVTLLPKHRGANAFVQGFYRMLEKMGIRIGSFYLAKPIANQMTVDQRRDALGTLVANQSIVFRKFNDLKGQFQGDRRALSQVQKMESNFQKRMDYLQKLLNFPDRNQIF